MINVKKTKLWKGDWKVVDGGALLGNVMTPTPITIWGEAIWEVWDFKYLGNTFTTSRDLEKELNHCWVLVIGKFVQLQPIWFNN
jgi:hypothetical protein